MTILHDYRSNIALESSSRAYLSAQLLTMAIYVACFMIYTLPFVSAEPRLFAAFLLKYSIEAAFFISLSHLLLRPILKPMQHNGASWHSIMQFMLQVIIASVLLSCISYLLTHLDILRSTDMSLVTVDDPARAKTFQMTFSPTFIIVTYSVMFITMYLVWTFAYVVWHSWQARKALQQQMQQAQLHQLTNQLSPHFLFNAFNSIRALIFEDQHKAADTVTRLSELFRFHLQAHLQPESTLAEEWQLTEQYLAIEQVRLEHRLQFSCDIADSLWQKKLPTLSLLSLAENAIKHGIAPNSAGGTLTLVAKPQINGWQLTVTNTMKAATEQGGTGTGLNNLRKRLQLMYASKAQLQLITAANQFSVVLELTDV